MVALFQHIDSTLVKGQKVLTHPPTLEEIMWFENVVTALDYRQLCAEGICDIGRLAGNPRDDLSLRQQPSLWRHENTLHY